MDDLVKRLRTKNHSLVTQSFIMVEAADRIEALELALTQSRAETAAAVEMLNDADHQYNRRTNDMIARHAAAQAKSRAETAAAYERAVKAVTDAPVFSDSDTDGQSAAKVIALGRAAKAIRALATPEQTAALDAVRAQGMREAAEIAGNLLIFATVIPDEDTKATYSEFVDDAILAAIKGDKA